MWVFLKRYFGWYVWLGLYASAIGAFVGMACFSVPAAGMICARVFGKHGDRASIFDVNAALDAARGSPPPAKDTG